MNKNTLINIALLPVMILVIFLDRYGRHHTIMSLYILGINLLAVYRSRKNLYIFVTCAMLTYCHYCIIFSYYITDYTKLIHFAYPYGDIAITGIIIMCLFSYGLLIAVPKIEDDAPSFRLITEDCRDNPYIVVAMVVFTLVCTFLVYKIPPKGELTNPERANGWVRNIDKYLLLILYYSGNRKIVRRICTLLLFMYCARFFMGGERGSALGAMIIFYLAVYAKKIKLRTLIIPSMLLIIFFRGIVKYRATLFYMDNVAGALMEETLENKFIVDTPIGAWWATHSYLYALNFDGWDTRLYMFGLWFINMFRVHEGREAALTAHVLKYTTNAGGGMFEFYFYYWLGLVGIIVVTLILHFMFRIFKRAVSSDNGYIRCLAIYWAGNVAGWYLYSPSTIFRAGGVLAIQYYLLDFGHKFMKKAIAYYLHRKPST